MESTELLSLLVAATMGLSWTIVYLLVIYRSFKDKQCGMPSVAMAFNLSWEFLYSFMFYDAQSNLQLWINRVWFVFDVLIFVAFLMYGAKQWNKLYQKFFFPYAVAMVLAAFSLLYFLQLDFGDSAITYSAFTMNVLMSWMFITMFLKQQDLKGQAFGIAFFKMLGTAAATIILFLRYSQFLQMMGVLCFILDMIYIILMTDRYKKLNLHLITRRLKA
ncbi:transmembrane-type terpene cyclase [Lacibacter sp. H407]|uniref:transmembrane-type terpene cyclase n=1 Tax=Lacibacter sp. H407 TaxID=3133423 RepID=UPI0030C11CB0